MGHRVPGWDVLGLLAGEVRPEMVEVVRRCGERLHTALLTNNVVTMRAEAMAGAPPGDASPVTEVLALFDVIVESSVVGVRKPEPRFYEIACERLGIAPANCRTMTMGMSMASTMKSCRSMSLCMGWMTTCIPMI